MKTALTALVCGALFVAILVAGGHVLGVWDDVPRAAPPASRQIASPRVAEATPDDEVEAKDAAKAAKAEKASARWRRQANALCGQATRDARALTTGRGEPTTIEDVIALAEDALRGERLFLDRLAALEPSASDRAIVVRMLSLFEKHHRYFRKTVAHLRRNDLMAALATGQRADGLMADIEHLLTFELRATRCGGGEPGFAPESLAVALPG